MLTVRSTINISSQTVPPIIPVVQGDTGRAILFTLADFTIPAGATATYYVQKPSGEAVYNNATIDGNNVLVNLTAQSIIEKGDNYGQVRIAVGEDIVTSFDFILLVKEFRGIEAVQSLTEMNIFDKAVEQAADAIDDVKTDALDDMDSAKTAALDDIGDAKDAALQEIEQSTGNFADDFSASATYAAGDYVMHSGQLYRFTANHAAGAWTGSDAEAVTVGEELTDLKAETTELKEDINHKISVKNGYTIKSDTGADSADANGSTVEMLVIPGIVISGFTHGGLDKWHGYAFYDEYGNFLSGGDNIGAGTYNWNYSVTVPTGAYIFKISCTTSYLSRFKAIYSGSMESVINRLKLLAPSDVIIDDYSSVPQMTVSGKTIGSEDGAIITSATDSYVEIPVVPGAKVSGYTRGGLDVTHGYAFYDADGVFVLGGNNIGAGTYDWLYSVTAPANAAIFRITCETSYIARFKASYENIINNTVKAVSEIPVNNVFYCGSTRTLNTLKKGIEKASKYKNSILYVDAGVYDLVEEFGSSWFDGLTSSDVHAGLQLGNGIHVIFSPNSKVVSHYTGNNQYAQSYYSPINIAKGGFTIENLTLECSKCRYAVHDERDGAAEQCKSEYINCTFSIDNTNNTYWTNAVCIGGGLGSNHCVSIFGSKFSSAPTGEKARAGVYYHLSNDTSNPEHRCIIDIQGNYLETGTVMLDFTRTDSSKKTQVIIANNSLKSVSGKQANGLYYGGGFTDACADIMTWNNEIRE